MAESFKMKISFFGRAVRNIEICHEVLHTILAGLLVLLGFGTVCNIGKYFKEHPPETMLEGIFFGGKLLGLGSLACLLGLRFLNFNAVRLNTLKGTRSITSFFMASLADNGVVQAHRSEQVDARFHETNIAPLPKICQPVASLFCCVSRRKQWGSDLQVLPLDSIPGGSSRLGPVKIK